MPASTYEELIGFVRVKSGSPPISVVSDGVAEMLLRGEIDYLTNELNLSKHLWVSATTKITFNVGNDIIEVPGADQEFGKPYSVETMDSGDPNHHTRKIPIVDPAELVRTYHGGDPSPVGAKHTAEAIAFFVESGVWKCRLGPKAGAYSEYFCLYEPPTARPAALDSQGFPFTQFEDYLTWRGAVVFLPHAKKWFKEMDALEQYEDLLGSAQARAAEGDRQFGRWKRTNRNQNNFRSRPFGARRRFRRRSDG